MNPTLVFSILAGYFLLLMVIAKITTRNSSAESFFTGNKQSPWYLVAFGMIGATLSGVTFISVPGEVGNSDWSYFQVVLGYMVGYFIIATVLLPLYYKLKLVSIYQYLGTRFGDYTYKTGAAFFILSRIIGASFRLFLVAGVLQIAFFDAFDIPFWVSVMVTIALIWLYTFNGGIKTIVWTDTLQTLFMLSAVLISIYFIADNLNYSLVEVGTSVWNDSRSTIFNFNWSEPGSFIKQFLAGAFIAVVMTGLDQDMMQKNLTCRSLKDAQKNMFWFTIVLVFVNLLFLTLGVLLYQFAETNGITLSGGSDSLYPFLAINHFSLIGGIVFLLGITAAAYSSADSALTALTTSFYIDFLNKKPNEDNGAQRKFIHFGFSVAIFLVILLFQAINNQSVISAVFQVAGYTYGPLLGLYAFGLFKSNAIHDKYSPAICLASPVLTYIINLYSENLLFGYKFGFELLLLNGAITFFGLWAISKNEKVLAN